MMKQENKPKIKVTTDKKPKISKELQQKKKELIPKIDKSKCQNCGFIKPTFKKEKPEPKNKLCFICGDDYLVKKEHDELNKTKHEKILKILDYIQENVSKEENQLKQEIQNFQ